MHAIQKNKINTKANQFFSNLITPQSEVFIQSFNSQIDHDPIFYMASQIKRKITKSLKKSTKEERSVYANFKNKKDEQVDTNFSLSIPQNRTMFANFTKNSQQQNQDKPFNTLENERKLLSKVTIHRIRSQRQSIESQTKRLQNSYNYLFQKMQKNKRKSLETAYKNHRNKEIQVQSKKQKIYLSEQKSILQQQNILQKSRLRQSVIHQKKNKQKTIIDFYNNLQANASQIRFQSNEIEEQILRTELDEIQCKKNKFLNEKESQKLRLLKRQKSLEDKRLTAQTQFKNKWLKEFNQTSKARKTYINKRENLSKKIQLLCQELDTEHFLDFQVQNKHQNKKKVRNNQNPEELT